MYPVVKPLHTMLYTYQYLYWLNFQKSLKNLRIIHYLDT